MQKSDVTLCFPDTEKSCFACCPPIRPAGYEHIEYGNIIGRFLRENTEKFNRNAEEIIPITGFSCWALGYMDCSYKQIGCLLHPAQNEGTDLRYRVAYGEKCQREACPEARVFSQLETNVKKFWLHLTDGLDSFAFSSRKHNPLFNLMGWGIHILSLVARENNNSPPAGKSFFRSYPFFSSKISPKANAYFLNRLIKDNIHLLKNKSFIRTFETLSERLIKQLTKVARNASDGPHVHLLDLDSEFSDFLRSSLHIRRMTRKHALGLQKIADDMLGEFLSGLH